MCVLSCKPTAVRSKRDRGWHCLFRRGAFLTARSPPLDRMCGRYVNEGRKLHSTGVDLPDILVCAAYTSVAALPLPVADCHCSSCQRDGELSKLAITAFTAATVFNAQPPEGSTPQIVQSNLCWCLEAT